MNPLAASPDAGLIQLLERIEAGQKDWSEKVSVWANMVPGDAVHQHAMEAADEAALNLDNLMWQAVAITAHTEQGKAVKARLTQYCNGYLKPDGKLEDNAGLLISMIHSLTVDMVGPLPTPAAG